MTTIIAKYLTKCYVCGQYINPGDIIVINDNKPAIHKNCPKLNKRPYAKFLSNTIIGYCCWCNAKLMPGDGELWYCFTCKQHESSGLHISCINTEECYARVTLQKKGK